MGRKSPIEWLEGGGTWNWLYGCTKVAAGCLHCYAERVVPRLGLRAVGPLARAAGESRGATYRGNVIVREDHLDDPLTWKKPQKIFVNSLSDTFHEDVPDALLDRAFDVMRRADQHTYLLLTKRASRMRQWFASQPRMRNVWAGYSASTRNDLDAGLVHLRATVAEKRFLSLEPLIEALDLGPTDLSLIDWVIVGGESGRLARPCQEKWVRQVVRACKAANVPVFVKQMGAWWAHELRLTTGPVAIDTRGGEPSLWADDLKVRQVPRG